MSQQLDAQGEAHEALGTAVASYGPRVLSDPHTLGNLVADLLPDLPRERSLLVTGAEADVAAEMRQHVEEQRIDPDTAVQLVARTLSERRAIDPAAGLWVASEYAQALGYQIRPYTAAVPSGPLSGARQAGGRHAAGQAGPAAPASRGPSPQSWPPAGPVPQRPPGPVLAVAAAAAGPAAAVAAARSPGTRAGPRRSRGRPAGAPRSPGHRPGRHPGSPGRRPRRPPAPPRARGPAASSG